VTGPRVLIIDGYPKRVREKLVEDGATVAAELYTNTLKFCRADVSCETVYAADADSALPTGEALDGFDGAVWTGSVVSVRDTEDSSVRRQIDFARAVFDAGVSGFGSCFAIQIATVAAGGAVIHNPKGREVGIGHGLALTEAWRAHPIFEGRAPVFEAAMIHEYMVATLPPGGVVLAENDMAPIQAATFPVGRSVFTGVQYHPEFHAAELGAILWRQRKTLVREGFYPDFDTVPDKLST
jgi:GMP synthase (glutamine-hydrolysing)